MDECHVGNKWAWTGTLCLNCFEHRRRLKPRLRFCIWINVCEGGAELIGWRKIHIDFPFSLNNRKSLGPAENMLTAFTYASLTNCVQRWPDHSLCCKRAPGITYWEGKRSGSCSHFYGRFAVILYSEVTVNFEKSGVSRCWSGGVWDLMFSGVGKPQLPLTAAPGSQHRRNSDHRCPKADTPKTRYSTLAEGQPLYPAEVWDLPKQNIMFIYYAGKRHQAKTQVKKRMRGDKYDIFKPYEFLSSSALLLS